MFFCLIHTTQDKHCYTKIKNVHFKKTNVQFLVDTVKLVIRFGGEGRVQTKTTGNIWKHHGPISGPSCFDENDWKHTKNSKENRFSWPNHHSHPSKSPPKSLVRPSPSSTQVPDEKTSCARKAVILPSRPVRVSRLRPGFVLRTPPGDQSFNSSSSMRFAKASPPAGQGSNSSAGTGGASPAGRWDERDAHRPGSCAPPGPGLEREMSGMYEQALLDQRLVLVDVDHSSFP